MNSNDLMYYLKGFVDLTNEPPSRDQWGAIRAKVKEASPVDHERLDGGGFLHLRANDPPLVARRRLVRQVHEPLQVVHQVV